MTWLRVETHALQLRHSTGFAPTFAVEGYDAALKLGAVANSINLDAWKLMEKVSSVLYITDVPNCIVEHFRIVIGCWPPSVNE